MQLLPLVAVLLLKVVGAVHIPAEISTVIESGYFSLGLSSNLALGTLINDVTNFFLAIPPLCYIKDFIKSVTCFTPYFRDVIYAFYLWVADFLEFQKLESSKLEQLRLEGGSSL